MADLYLASTSPRRATLLQQIGVAFSCLPVEVDETPQVNEDPAEFVVRVASAKARYGAAQQAANDGIPVLGADTAVVIAQKILGKPASVEAAREMLRSLSGRQHRVLSAVAVVADNALQTRISETLVTFCPLNEQQIKHYVDSGEPKGKAGSYAIQGLAAAFIRQIHGSYSGVMGLPLQETSELLIELNIPFAANGQFSA